MLTARDAAIERLTEAPEIIGSRLEEAYANSRPYQWVIELWRNFHQVVERTPEDELRGDERQVFDVLPFHGGALKRVIWNTAKHMTEAELRKYFSTLGTGHGNTWRLDNPTGNRHAGAREMLLPWNPAGMVVISYHPTEMPDGAMLWILKDSKGYYGLKHLPTGNVIFDELETDIVVPLGEDDLGLDWREAMPTEFMEKGGVAFILLGTDVYEDDPSGVDTAKFKAAGRKPETTTGIANALLDRVAHSRGQVTVVYQVGSTATSVRLVRVDSKGEELAYDSRHVYGSEGWVTYGQRRKTLLHETGIWHSETGRFSIEWTLLNKPRSKASGMTPFSGKGHVVARYRDEFMDVPPVTGTQGQRLARWGIIYKEVQDRLSLRIIPKATPTPESPWHVRQGGASRSSLVTSEGSEIPWEDWRDEWVDSIPGPIREALNAARHETVSDNEAARRLLARIRSRVNKGNHPNEVEVIDPDAEGTFKAGDEVKVLPMGEPRNGKGKGDGAKAGVHEAVPGGDRGSRPRRRVQELPGQEWLNPDQWAEFAPDHLAEMPHGLSEDACFVVLADDGEAQTLFFNEGHPIYRDQIAYYVGEWLKDRRGAIGRLSAEEVTDSIKTAYWLDSAGRFYATVKHLGLAHAKRALENDPMLLTYGAEGFVNVDQAIQTDLGGKASGRRKTA